MTNAQPERKMNPSERMDRVPPGLGVMGMWIFIVALAVLFISTLVGYFYIRFTYTTWRLAQIPPFPLSLWVSSFIIILSSWTHQRGLYAIRRDERDKLKRYMLATLLLALSFLGVQIYSWIQFLRVQLPGTQRSMYTFTFYLLTALHALHVLGGLIPLGIVTAKSYWGRYTRYRYEGVTHCIMYWHFLGIVWIVLFLTLLSA